MGPNTSHRVLVTDHGGPDVLRFVEADLPEPADGEVRVRVLAAGVSAFDLIYRRWGRLPGSPELPFTLGEDVVGVVDETGSGVDALEPGQLVADATFAVGIGGGYSEHVCLPERDLVPVPAGIDPAEAVCLVVNYLTAHEHLHGIGAVRPGERALIHGAAGGVGSALLDLGRRAGLELYGTASQPNHDLLRSFDATPIDYRTEDFVERIGTLTGDGVDVVVDPVGGARHLWRSYRTLRRAGRLVWLGSAAVEQHGLRIGPSSIAATFLLRLVPDGRHVPRCPTVDAYARSHPGWYRATLGELLDALAAGELRPVVAQRIPLAEADRAHTLLERGGHAGKVVLTTSAYEAPQATDRSSSQDG